MQVEIVEKDGLRREITIEVPADVVDAAYDKIFTEFRKNAKIKGFRPGKIPLSVIRTKFKQEATAEVVDDLVNKYFNEVVKEKKLAPVSKPVVSKVDIDEGKPLTFTVGIEILPEIDTIKLDDLIIQQPKIEVPGEEVDRVVEQLRKSHADIRTVERPAGPNDILICSLEVIEGDIDTGDIPLDNQEIDLDNEYTVREFRQGLVGVSRDDTRDITIDYADDYQDEKFAGKSITYKVVVKEVKERVLPLLNDDFARQVGQSQTLLELRLDIRKHLEAEQRRAAFRAGKKTIVDQVTEQNPIEVPESMVASYLEGIIEDYRQQNEKFDEAELRDKYRPVGVNAVRWYMLYHRLAEQENIEVSSEDTENWIKKFAENYRMDVLKAKEILAKTGKVSEIKDNILEEKVVDFLMARAGVRVGTAENKEG